MFLQPHCSNCHRPFAAPAVAPQLGVGGQVANGRLGYLQGEGLLASGALLLLLLLLLLPLLMAATQAPPARSCSWLSVSLPQGQIVHVYCRTLPHPLLGCCRATHLLSCVHPTALTHAAHAVLCRGDQDAREAAECGAAGRPGD